MIYADITRATREGAMGIAREAAQLLQEGGVVIFPTETVYGIGCLARFDDSVRKIYDIKNRPLSKPLPVMVDRVENISRAARYTPFLSALEGEYMPGPVTVILRKKTRFDSLAAAGKKTVAVRIPDHAFLLSLLIMLQEPLAATSANISGMPAPSCYEDIDPGVLERADMAINMGECSVGLSSTIIDLSGPEIRVLREGSVPGERLIEYLKETVL